MPLEDLQPLGRWSYYAGSAATVTLASGEALIALWAHATTAASLVITPKGANQTGTAGPTITIPANTVLGPITFVGQMTGGTILVFTGTDAYWVQVHTLVSGGAAVLTKGF